MLQCGGAGAENDARYVVFDFDFFDDDSLVIAYRVNGAAGACSMIRHLFHDELNLGTIQGTTVATVGYSDLHYQEVQPVDPLGELSREQLIAHALEVGEVLNTQSEDNCAEF